KILYYSSCCSAALYRLPSTRISIIGVPKPISLRLVIQRSQKKPSDPYISKLLLDRLVAKVTFDLFASPCLFLLSPFPFLTLVTTFSTVPTAKLFF
ncbi:hypothetical protein EDD21DRAFT_449319, partial [Dissophora ornata]